ncbi:cox cluster protein [Haladaptatus paucihalophilus DX253]|uniref:Cox cluster protein n=1 Tax=Haladaptatus paucihalophilus DX253 TaxID=797209 RepID=E7QRH6_HALPU|nr:MULTISPECIES: DUF6684 family protein [Haladaptatus]EFW92595.1 cox cluster protein [Haladaptatus paucihalophilus DX253]ODR79686.1 cox cluster protein [Haladaptatus sp. W1]GKZ13804.1 hypothetical protein HAL_16850 [Haladaptatus sp. T7]SHK18133.1 hypothetical protein SAMN05444342_0861 [Haladaptatus paucihalophilus DX253]
MAESVFDKETLLDLTVNIIPLGILAFFLILFVGFSAWGGSTLVGAVSLGLVIVPFALLALLTYIAALKIEATGGT